MLSEQVSDLAGCFVRRFDGGLERWCMDGMRGAGEEEGGLGDGICQEMFIKFV